MPSCRKTASVHELHVILRRRWFSLERMPLPFLDLDLVDCSYYRFEDILKLMTECNVDIDGKEGNPSSRVKMRSGTVMTALEPSSWGANRDPDHPSGFVFDSSSGVVMAPDHRSDSSVWVGMAVLDLSSMVWSWEWPATFRRSIWLAAVVQTLWISVKLESCQWSGPQEINDTTPMLH